MKKIIMFIIVFTLGMFLSACGEAKQNLDFVNMQTNIYEATICLSDSNKLILDAMEMDSETCINYFKQALELVKSGEVKTNQAIASPNFISEELVELEENYEETIDFLSRFSELSEKEEEEVINLLTKGTEKHILLVKSLNAFSYLYEIREFDKLPDNEAKRTLRDSWWKFGFNEDIECPETIDEQELYLIWARQFFYIEEFDEEKFLEELQALRKSDDLSSPECNKKWTEFIENFI